jgi:hypothetical protein
MKRILLALCTLLTIACCTVQAQTEAEIKSWMDYMTPGDMHKMVASWDGTWNGDITMWMAPGAPPATNTATMTNKMALGGRYQIGNYSGSFAGMPFEGMSILSYDNIKKIFESIWIDNMGTGVMHLQGPWDEATKTITLTGKMIDAMTGKETTMKETLKIIDENTQLMEMYAPSPDGKEFKSMEIKLTRKK